MDDQEGPLVRRLVALVIALCSLALGGPAVTLAQEATPAAGGFPITPDPTECQVEARTVDEFVAVLGAATPTTPDLVGTTVEVPLGEAADAETVAGVTTTIREILACFNAGDFSRALSLFSSEAINRIAAEDPITEEELRSFLEATPQAAPAGQQSTLLALTDVMELEDGRVGALMATTDPFVGPDTAYIIFVQENDRWRIDEIIEFLDPNAGGQEAEATPAG